MRSLFIWPEFSYCHSSFIILMFQLYNILITWNTSPINFLWFLFYSDVKPNFVKVAPLLLISSRMFSKSFNYFYFIFLWANKKTFRARTLSFLLLFKLWNLTFFNGFISYFLSLVLKNLAYWFNKIFFLFSISLIYIWIFVLIKYYKEIKNKIISINIFWFWREI